MAEATSNRGVRHRHRNAASRSHGHRPAIRYHAGSSSTEVNCCVKYSIFGFNVLFFVLGFIMLGIGIWAQAEKKSVYSQLQRASSFYLDPSLILFCVGLVTFLIGFSGCVGSLRENTWLLTVYSTLLGLLLIAEFAAGVYLYLCRDDFAHQLTRVLEDMIVGYREDPDLQTVIDSLQQTWQCCGIRSAEDWDSNVYFAQSASNVSSPEAGGVPFSCCKEEYRVGNDGLTNLACGQQSRIKERAEFMNRIYTTGCQMVVESCIHSNVLVVGVGAILVAIIQMLGICFAQNLKSDILAQKAKWLQTER